VGLQTKRREEEEEFVVHQAWEGGGIGNLIAVLDWSWVREGLGVYTYRDSPKAVTVKHATGDTRCK
jgi:hypothetical protein